METALNLEELDIELVPGPRVGPGRQAAEITAEFSRALTRADLSMPVLKSAAPPSIKEIRDSHHALARVLATGTKEGEASIITGYSPSRISVLKADPQFQQLLEFYRETATDVVADFRARMADMGMDALAVLRDKLEADPDSFSGALLKEIVMAMADRTGHAPQRGPTSVTQINVGLGDRMEAARQRMKLLQAPKSETP